MKKIIYILIAVALIFVANKCSKHETPIQTETIKIYSAELDSNGDTIPNILKKIYIYNYDKKGRLIRYQCSFGDIYCDETLEYTDDKISSLTTNDGEKFWYEDGIWYMDRNGVVKIVDEWRTGTSDYELRRGCNLSFHYGDVKSEENNDYFHWTKKIMQDDNGKYTIATRDIVYQKITPSVFIRNLYTHIRISCILHLNIWGIIDDETVFNYLGNTQHHPYGGY